MTTNQSNNLRPCPFCGGEAELCYSEVDIFCRKCNVMQETEMWNTRPIEDALQARAEKAEAMVERLIEVFEKGKDIRLVPDPEINKLQDWAYKLKILVTEWKEREE